MKDPQKKAIPIVLAVIFLLTAVSGVLFAVNTSPLEDAGAIPAPPSPSPTTDIMQLSDEELAQMGTVLDESGVSLMPKDFSFVDITYTTAPAESVEPSPTASEAAASPSAAPTEEAKATEEPLPTVTPEPQATHSLDAYASLKPGQRNEAVITLQKRLMELDYLSNDEPTNYYGTQTAYAVQLFQFRNGLEASGVMNLATAKKLFSENAGTYKVSQGVSGTDVTELQKRLKELGYLDNVTGYFGTDTDRAVREFQKANGLTVDGMVGRQTRDVLYSTNAIPKKQTTPSKTPSTQAPTKTDPPADKTQTPSTQKPNTQATSSPKLPDIDSAKAAEFIELAKQHLGKPYVLGGKGPDVFDCSGFIYYVLRFDMGYDFYYHTSYGWADINYPTVSKQDLRAGDILCFRGHVGIYLGNGSMLDASSTDGKIRITHNIWQKNYWITHFLYGKRFFT